MIFIIVNTSKAIYWVLPKGPGRSHTGEGEKTPEG